MAKAEVERPEMIEFTPNMVAAGSAVMAQAFDDFVSFESEAHLFWAKKVFRAMLLRSAYSPRV